MCLFRSTQIGKEVFPWHAAYLWRGRQRGHEDGEAAGGRSLARIAMLARGVMATDTNEHLF